MRLTLILLMIALTLAVVRAEAPVVVEKVELVQVHDTDPGYGTAPDSYIHTLRVNCQVRNTRGVSASHVRVVCNFLTGDGKLYYADTQDIGILKAHEVREVKFQLHNPADSDGVFRKMKVRVELAR